ncbi:MAG: immunoglobulin domain-containing protein [Limisphaerales bacterium]
MDVPLLGIANFSVTASSGTTMSYQWYRDGNAIGGANSSSYSILVVLGLGGGTYSVLVSNAGGSVMSANATLNLAQAPVIYTQPQSQPVIQGQSASFSVGANALPNPSYQWYFNSSRLASGTSSTLALSNVGASQAGNYRVVLANSAGTVTSAVAVLTVYVPPALQTQPTNQSVIVGQSTAFSVVVSSPPPFRYQWNFNGAALPGATNSALNLSNVQTNQAGSYNVVVSNPAGSITSQVATLAVNVPAGIATQPQNQIVLLGQPASFSVVATGTSPIVYQWYFNATLIDGATNSTLSVPNVQQAQAGSYTVQVANPEGSVISSAATLSVQPPPVLSVTPGAVSTTEFSFQFSVPVGHTFIVLASGDLRSWTSIGTNVAVSGTSTFVDTATTNYPQRFYRVVTQ